MSDIQVILQNSILSTAGAEGLARFNKAVSPDAVLEIVGPDGSLDLSRLMNMLLDVFHEDQASSIMDNTLARYMEIANEEPTKEYSILESVVQESPSDATDILVQDGVQQESALADGSSVQKVKASDQIHSDNTIIEHSETVAQEISAANVAVDPGQDGAQQESELTDKVKALQAGDQEYREHEIADYFEADAGEVRDLINEARRIRIAMGKPAPKINKQPSFGRPIQAAEEAPRPEPMGTIRKAPRSITLNNELLDQEIDEYILKNSLTSIDAMDVMMYLKEKGYYFQENTVLEKVYIKIEEQKKKVRNWILRDIQVFLADKAWPNENDVAAYIRHVHELGIVYDEAEIRRMILNEMMRKA